MRNFEDLGRSLAIGSDGMAATSHPQATLTALDVLKAGGSAMDAAIAASAVQCVVEPGSTGLGGDCFALYSRQGSGDVIAFNGSGRAPAAATRERVAGLLAAQGEASIPRGSAHAVTIPGAVDAWCQLARDHGRLPLARILAPAIAMATDGYAITPRVHCDWVEATELLRHDPAAARILLVDGAAPGIGSRHRQLELAATLTRIARDGRAAFYQGAVAADIVERLAAGGGLHSLADFNEAAGQYVEPVRTAYRGHEVVECPPNGQGLIALILLNILSGKPVTREAYGISNIHCEVEATRLAYGIREAMLCDPDAHAMPVEKLLSQGFADDLRARIQPGRIIEPLPDWSSVPHRDTVYITVVDKERNCASFINSVFWGFGSGIMAPRSGVMLQNRGMSFSLAEGHPNAIAPRKRPRHTIIPAMLLKEGRVVMPFGVMGGDYQAMGHAWFLRRVLDDGLDIQAAMDLPRLFPLPGTSIVEVEARVPAAIRDGLAQLGYSVQNSDGPIGGSQAIQIDWQNGTLIGASDPRKDGCALGY